MKEVIIVKMRNKSILALSLSLVMALASCGGSTSTAPTASANPTTPNTDAAPTTTEIVDDTTGLKIPCDPIELSLGCSGTVEGTIMGDALDKYIAELKEWTDGNFVINFYPSGQLGGDVELIEGTQMGSVDMFTGAPTSQVGLIPELAVLDIAGLYETVEQCNAVLTGGFTEQIEPYYNNAGLHLLTAFSTNFRITSSNHEIKNMDDLKGMNIRVQENKYHIEFWKALGSNPTPLAFGELYIALQQGMMDAQENPWTSFIGAKICEVQKYMTLTNHIPFVSTYVMNNNKYSNMSDNQKQALNQFIHSITIYQTAGAEADDARLRKIAEDEFGITVNEVSDDIRAAYPAATEAVVELMKKDIDATFVEEYVATARAVTGN